MGKLGETQAGQGTCSWFRKTGLSRLHGKEREDGGGGGMHDLKMDGKGRNTHTPHTTHRTQGHKGGVVKSSGWLTDEADWPGWMVSKTAVPSFPCIGLQCARDQHV